MFCVIFIFKTRSSTTANDSNLEIYNEQYPLLL